MRPVRVNTRRGKSMGLHRQPPLGKAHFEPVLDPARADANDLFVGGAGLQIGVELEERQAAAYRAFIKNEVAVHEDNQIIIFHRQARHGPQHEPDCGPFARNILADDA